MERVHADSKTEIYTKKAVYVIRKSNTTKSNHSQIHFVIKKKSLHYMVFTWQVLRVFA